MILTFICIIFSSLHFDGLTLPMLFQWYCNHPFLFMLALGEIFSYTVNVRR